MHTRLRSTLITSLTALTLGAATLATMGASGCSKQATAAALVSEVGTDVGVALQLGGVSTFASQNVQNLFQVAASDISTWKPGTSGDNAVQALKDATAALSDVLPPGSKVDAYVNLALGTVENIITLIQSESSVTPVATGGIAAPAVAHASTTTARVVTLAHPPTTASQFRSQWAALGGRVPLH